MNDAQMMLLECKKEEIFTPISSPQRRTPFGSQASNDNLLSAKPSPPSTPQKVSSFPFPMESKPESEEIKKRRAEIKVGIDNFKKRKLAEQEEYEYQKSKLRDKPMELVRRRRTTVPNKNVIHMDEMSEDPAISKRQCLVCYSVFDSPIKMKRHLATHADKVEAFCNLCHAPLKYSYNIKAHFSKCFMYSVQEKEQMIVKQNFPHFLRQLDHYAKGKTTELPALPEGFTMNSKGKVTGSSTTKLRVDYKKIIPGWGLTATDRMGYQFENDDSCDELN